MTPLQKTSIAFLAAALFFGGVRVGYEMRKPDSRVSISDSSKLDSGDLKGYQSSSRGGEGGIPPLSFRRSGGGPMDLYSPKNFQKGLSQLPSHLERSVSHLLNGNPYQKASPSINNLLSSPLLRDHPHSTKMIFSSLNSFSYNFYQKDTKVLPVSITPSAQLPSLLFSFQNHFEKHIVVHQNDSPITIPPKETNTPEVDPILNISQSIDNNSSYQRLTRNTWDWDWDDYTPSTNVTIDNPHPVVILMLILNGSSHNILPTPRDRSIRVDGSVKKNSLSSPGDRVLNLKGLDTKSLSSPGDRVLNLKGLDTKSLSSPGNRVLNLKGLDTNSLSSPGDRVLNLKGLDTNSLSSPGDRVLNLKGIEDIENSPNVSPIKHIPVSSRKQIWTPDPIRDWILDVKDKTTPKKKFTQDDLSRMFREISPLSQKSGPLKSQLLTPHEQEMANSLVRYINRFSSSLIKSLEDLSFFTPHKQASQIKPHKKDENLLEIKRHPFSAGNKLRSCAEEAREEANDKTLNLAPAYRSRFREYDDDDLKEVSRMLVFG